jgi:molybdopterin-guanine dinucleotide biosynthesis protein A
MVSYVLDALRCQVGPLLINANRNAQAYAAHGCEIVADGDTDFRGPLAGMASGLRVAVTEWVLTAPCDCPMVAEDLAARLYAAAATDGRAVAVAHDGLRLQPVFALIKRELLPQLETYLGEGGRKIDRWFDACGCAVADFSDVPASFSNINEPSDIDALEQTLVDAIEPKS